MMGYLKNIANLQFYINLEVKLLLKTNNYLPMLKICFTSEKGLTKLKMVK